MLVIIIIGLGLNFINFVMNNMNILYIFKLGVVWRNLGRGKLSLL